MQAHEGDYLWMAPASEKGIDGGGELQIYVDAKTHPRARASAAKFTLGVGFQLPIHRHDKTEEFAYVLSGTGAAIVIEDGKEKEIPLAAGYVWYNPPGAWHAVRKTGDTQLSMFFVTVPNEKKGLLSFFRKVCASPGKPGMVLTPEEFERIGREHDLILRKSDSSND